VSGAPTNQRLIVFNWIETGLVRKLYENSDPEKLSARRRVASKKNPLLVIPPPLTLKLANHESARTIGPYDRRNDQLTLDEVERILI
jgi:hypothetical protein